MIYCYLYVWEVVCVGGWQGGKIGEFDMAFCFWWLVAVRSMIIQSFFIYFGLCYDFEVVFERLY